MFELDDIKTQLLARMQNMRTSYQHLERGQKLMAETINLQVNLPEPENLLDLCLAEWLTVDLLRPLNALKQGHTYESVSLQDLDEHYYSLRYFDEHFQTSIRDGLYNNTLTLEHAIALIVRLYPFEALLARLTTLGEELVQKGLKKSAEILASEFNLHQNSHQFYAPKKCRGLYEFKHAPLSKTESGYAKRSLASLRELITALEVLESEMDDDGLREPMQTIYQAFDTTKDWFDSGTKLAEGQRLQAIVRKDFITFQLTPAAAESILAFVKLYSDVPLVDLSRAA